MHLGLRPEVAALDELGFFYVDNGNSTLRLRSALVQAARSGERVNVTRELASRHDGFFVECDSAADAARSFSRALIEGL